MHIPASFSILTILLLCNSASAATLRLNWRDTSSLETGFKIERLSGANYVEIGRVGANVQSYTDSTAASGANHCYRVRAFNSSGVSAPTNAACAMAPSGGSSGGGGSTPAPGSPTNPPSSPPAPLPTGGPAGNWKDYQLNMDLRSGDDDILGVMFRYQDPNNYYRFSWNAQAKTRRLEKKVNGVFHVLAQDAAVYNIWQRYPLQITARGSVLTVAVGGSTIFSVNDSSFSRGTIGLFSASNSRSYFDNIDARDLDTGNVLVADDFDDGDYVGWTVTDEVTENGPSQWSVRNGALVQTANIGKNGIGTYALYTGGTWSDYRMTFKMRTGDNDRIGFLFRFKDNSNHYRFVWEAENPGRTLFKQTNGVYTVLAQDTVPYNINQTYNIELIVQANSLKINIDGRAVFAVSDSTFSSGSVALYTSRNTSSSFDDVLVEDLKSKAVLLDDDFSGPNLTGWKAFDEPGTVSGPSQWRAVNGAVVQSSNIGSDATGFPGTFLLY